MRILVAEDDLTSRNMLTAVLQKAGYEVEAANDGLEAWQRLQQPDAPHLVVLDWLMPEMSGLEVVQHVRARPTDMPPYILMLTTRIKTADVVTALDAGANDYLLKPFVLGELRARVAVGRRMVEMQETLNGKIEELSGALSEIRTLRGFLPICANCKKIRDDQGYWNEVEVYVQTRTDAQFTHGFCPDCLHKLYPDL